MRIGAHSQGKVTITKLTEICLCIYVLLSVAYSYWRVLDFISNSFGVSY